MIEFKELISNLVFKRKDKFFSYIEDPQQKIYTITRLE